ncbi:MAG TPA: cupin domain-containing protein [Patescibacteria group bacterium]|jgi:mannose-6-phosphate isomerase-like protein (cupin superfamily)|nr:cupin domain-containing protein [Patescibacteria group bacterium]
MQKNLKDIPTEKTHHDTVFRKRLITTAENKGKLATYNYAWIEKGKQLEIHSHPDGEEFYLFLEGKGEMLVGDQWVTVGKDDFITVPKGNNHSVKNNNDQNLVFLTIRTVEN